VISFPNAKINLGLNVVAKRPDGFHDIETIFYPVELYDALEIIESDEIRLHISGTELEGEVNDNLVMKAFYDLCSKNSIPAYEIYLHKNIPSGAGLGGGSSDAAFMLRMLNEKCDLELDEERLVRDASTLGSDCAFFIKNSPQFATGRGEVLEDIDLDLSSYKIEIVSADIRVNTGWAYGEIEPVQPDRSLRELIQLPIVEWRSLIKNDFEEPVFKAHPQIGEIKQRMYDEGALFSLMTGSGSAVFGIFEK